MRVALVLTVLLSGGVARGQADYDPSSVEWNGLSNFLTLAEAEGLTILPRGEIDWSEIEPGDALFLLYPTTPVEPAHLMSYLRGGGRLLVADDYGKAQDSLARLNMIRKTTAVHAERYHENNDSLPLARAVLPLHPLADGVSELYTNHPAFFTVEAGPDVVFQFGKGEAAVVAGSLGEGRFVALSDPSVIINAMLAFDDNVQFAANLIHFLRPAPPGPLGQGQPGRIILLSGDFNLTGEPPATLDEARATSTLNDLLREFDKFLDELNDYLASKDALWGIGMVGATIFLVLVALLLLPSATRDLDGGWTRARATDDRVDFERFVAYYEQPGTQASYAYPAGVLRDGAEQELAELLGAEQPLALSAGELHGRLVEALGASAARQVVDELLPRILALPTRAQAQAPWGTRFVGWKEFTSAHDATQAFEAYCRRG